MQVRPLRCAVRSAITRDDESRLSDKRAVFCEGEWNGVMWHGSWPVLQKCSTYQENLLRKGCAPGSQAVGARVQPWELVSARVKAREAQGCFLALVHHAR